MNPVIALVGRPNVGKSTLFNCLTMTRDALVADQPGVTRDRQYGVGRLVRSGYIVVDTGGLSDEKDGLIELMAGQVKQAIDEADVLLFVVDARDGLLAGDQQIAQRLRQTGKTVYLVVNKIDGVDRDVASADFYALGLGEPRLIAANHGRGVNQLMTEVLEPFPVEEVAEEEADDAIRIALVGRPNVGKSTLINRILGEERVVVFDMPGTTRDTIKVPFERDGQHYQFIDTAGVRRRSKVEGLERFSVIKTMQAIAEAQVAIMVLDAHQGISEQDAHLLGHILEAGRALVIAVNKWDGLQSDEREWIQTELHRKLAFVPWARVHFISALHGSGVGELYRSVIAAHQSAMIKIPTPRLTRILEDAVREHQPPLVRGRRIKLRYAHQGGRNPPVVVIHGNQVDSVPDSYQRFLVNKFRQVLRLEGTPMRIEFKGSENPFQGKRNTLTPRQQAKRKRLQKHIKKQ